MNATGDKVLIYIVSLEKPGEAEMSSRVLIHIEFNGAENELFSREIYEYVLASLSLRHEDGLVTLFGCLEGLVNNPDRLLKRVGDSMRQKLEEGA
jgi:hypothetical protein